MSQFKNKKASSQVAQQTDNIYIRRIGVWIPAGSHFPGSSNDSLQGGFSRHRQFFRCYRVADIYPATWRLDSCFIRKSIRRGIHPETYYLEWRALGYPGVFPFRRCSQRIIPLCRSLFHWNRRRYIKRCWVRAAIPSFIIIAQSYER